ncbi:hypothetical protein RBSH_01357 [Rhodopirellula baltica SH28]|uniref:Uncharacterized protein n=1 Tax=Rhodopirellula baltica SH28 TaxID=993517 RepID=K5DKB5_RHOBT|nr:hypothetical protein RBSH_01357 [Rhodopirellula baltica SH28]
MLSSLDWSELLPPGFAVDCEMTKRFASKRDLLNTDRTMDFQVRRSTNICVLNECS